MAKVLIDIDKIEDFDYFKQTNICRANLCRAIKNGIVLDGLTNGDLITRIISPDSDDCVGIECEDGIVTFEVTEDAWNRKRGE